MDPVMGTLYGSEDPPTNRLVAVVNDTVDRHGVGRAVREEEHHTRLLRDIRARDHPTQVCIRNPCIHLSNVCHFMLIRHHTYSIPACMRGIILILVGREKVTRLT
jgi:hypothetical protein